MAYLNDRVLDYGLNELYTNGTRLDICTVFPTTFTEATDTYSIGYKTSVPWNAPAAADPTGRKLVCSAFSTGLGTADGDGVCYTITDPVNSRLLVVYDLDESDVIVEDDAFSVPQFEIVFPGVS
jgi:hypothetical protein